MTGVTGKLKTAVLMVLPNNTESEILACYEKKKDIRRVVIKIHKLGIAGGL